MRSWINRITTMNTMSQSARLFQEIVGDLSTAALPRAAGAAGLGQCNELHRNLTGEDALRVRRGNKMALSSIKR